VHELRGEIEAVRAMPSAAEDLERLALLERDSDALSRIFSDSIVPAVRDGDLAATRDAHAQAASLVEEMTRTADELGADLDRRAAAAEADAARQSWIVAALVALIAAATTLLALLAARRLWEAFTGPLAELTRIAERVGRGDRDARVGQPLTEEIQPVASAFDAMLDALAATEHELREADRLAAIGRVAAGIAHEMNNPLGVIRGYVKTMRRELESGKLRDDLATVDAEAEICERIVQDLLTYAKTPALVKTHIDAVELAREAAAKLSAVDGKGPVVRVAVDPAPLWVDPVRLRQVLVNLLRNALQADPGGGVSLTGVSRRGAYEFVIADHGPGLSDEARERMFEPFFTTRGDGTGLGLAVSFGLVIAHGGAITARDREGGGTEFHVTVPNEALTERAA
jgi:signal transduction histidine kinase